MDTDGRASPMNLEGGSAENPIDTEGGSATTVLSTENTTGSEGGSRASSTEGGARSMSNIGEVGRVNPANPFRMSVDDSGSSPVHISVDINGLQHPQEGRACWLGNVHYPLLNAIENRLSSLTSIPSDCCIYRVPTRLRNANDEAYTPQIVSIGPFHHGSSRLQAMEDLKWTYLQNFVHRTKKVVGKFLPQIEEWEPRARKCYAGTTTTELDHDKFSMMMLLDSVFVIETMLSFASPVLGSMGTYYTAHVISDVRPDMMLLENQLPFFVIEGLFAMAFSDRRDEIPSLLELSLAYFSDVMIMEGGVSQIKPTTDVRHFVDLLRTCHIKLSVRAFPIDGLKYVRTHNVTELDESGVKFEKGMSNCLLDIGFESGKLQIPRLVIQDMTETVLRNMVAFEACHYGICSYMIDYVYFMDNLIDTTKDVELLVRDGIIHNLLGDSTAVATLFNKMTEGATMRGSNFYYYRISEELNSFCRVPWHAWKATLRRDYFSTPWSVVATIAAIILLILTVVQTVCSIFSVPK